jgi:hypothetical protein
LFDAQMLHVGGEGGAGYLLQQPLQMAYAEKRMFRDLLPAGKRL